MLNILLIVYLSVIYGYVHFNVYRAVILDLESIRETLFDEEKYDAYKNERFILIIYFLILTIAVTLDTFMPAWFNNIERTSRGLTTLSVMIGPFLSALWIRYIRYRNTKVTKPKVTSIYKTYIDFYFLGLCIIYDYIAKRFK